jgi:polypeptide N-acetylgalactosaminyltransferase
VACVHDVIGWLQPLLDRIAENQTNVVTPIIDNIHEDTFRYGYSGAALASVGGFDWNLNFRWHWIPDGEVKRRKSEVDPVRWRFNSSLDVAL